MTNNSQVMPKNFLKAFFILKCIFIKHCKASPLWDGALQRVVGSRPSWIFQIYYLWGEYTILRDSLGLVLTVFFFYPGFLSRTLTIHGMTEERIDISLTPLYHFHQLHILTLRKSVRIRSYFGPYFWDLNQEPLASELKSLTTKLCVWHLDGPGPYSQFLYQCFQPIL